MLAIPLFVFFGALSDQIGRKKIMMAGCLLAVLAYYPIYQGMVYYAGNEVAAIESVPSTHYKKNRKLAPVKLRKPAHRRLRDNRAERKRPDAGLSCLPPARISSHDGLRADRGISRRSFPGAHPLHIALTAISHRQRRLRRLAANHRLARLRLHRKHLRRSLVSNDNRSQ